MSERESITVVLYDGVCGLCNRLNQFLLKRDSQDRFRFASLQSDVAAQLLQRHGTNAIDLDTVYVVADYRTANERLLARSDAVLHALKQLGGMWSFAAAAGRILPKPLRDAFYTVVAVNRYRVFGKFDVCLMPDERYRAKFLDVGGRQ
jgi:predicted DCC family thiol-disulfide oxidoreductase YuxK